MNPVLADIKSIINGYSNAKDKDRVFTYIEFVKMFGYDNDTNTFIGAYKDYVTQWSIIKKDSITLSDEEFVMSKMVEVLKSITLDYSSYEEQDFIAHIDLNNKDHLKGLTALYSRKIREITEFYRKKRNESVLVVNRNSMKGSVKSIQEIIYEKVFDFIFSNRNIVPSYKNIKRDLLISIENYVDTYSEYFDIPRQREFTDKSRAEMLSANMNDVDYRVYIEIQLVISEILFSGNVYLEEIPLVAQVGADLSQNCVGDMLALKNQLIANTTVNLVDLDEQVALKRKLYEKFLGCDLWYMYVDLQGNIKTDILCRAKQPSGNLLNCGTADTATIENEQLELLSHIGLFFKPDKTSILKVNAKDYTWSIDVDVIQNDTVYVFPDPNKYGDIGNNKNASYPLIMEYKVDYDVKNMSSGEACNDPIKMLSDQGWFSYYSKQDDDFKLFDNKNYDYAFTWLANRGFVTNYQVDAFGNQFGILKGCDVQYNYDEKGNKISVKSIKLNPKYNETVIKNNISIIDDSNPKILNGGYMENPLYKGKQETITVKKWRDNADKVPFKIVYDKTLKSWRRAKDNESSEYWCRVVRKDVSQDEIQIVDGENITNYVEYDEITYKWMNSGSVNNVVPFDYTKQLTLIDTEDDKYTWSGLKIKNDALYYSDIDTNFITFGEFGAHQGLVYKDHFGKKFAQQNAIEDDETIITDVVLEFLTQNMYESDEIEIIEDNKSFYELADEGGAFYVKPCGKLGTKPILFTDVFDWLPLGEDEKIKNFSIIYKTIILETDTRYLFIPYDYDGENFVNTIGIRELLIIDKFKKIRIKDEDTIIHENFLQTSLLFNEVTKCFYVLEIEEVIVNATKQKFRKFLVPRIYKFNCETYKMEEVINLYDTVCYDDCVKQQIDRIIRFDNRVLEKEQIAFSKIEEFKKLLNKADDTEDYYNLGNFEVPYYSEKPTDLKKVSFTYNSNLGMYLLSFLILDNNGTPYIHEHKFKLDNLVTFNDTLVSNVYTLKAEGDSYKWNNKVDAEQVATIPFNEKSLLSNEIWVEYDGKGDSNNGFDIGENNYIDNPNIDVNFDYNDYGSSNTTNTKIWKSTVYEGSAYRYKYNSTRQVTGRVDFDSSCIIKNQGINKFNIKYINLLLDGKAEEDVDNIELIQDGNENGYNSFDVICDIFGNISGNSTVKLKGINIKDTKRSIIGFARMNISGTVKNYTITVIITVWDVLKNEIIIPTPKPEDVIVNNGDWIFDSENWNVKLSSDVYLYDNIGGTKNKTYDNEKKLRIDPNYMKIQVNGSSEGAVVLGDNKVNLTFDQMYIFGYDGQTDEDKGNIIQYIIQNEGQGIDFNLYIGENGETGDISFSDLSDSISKSIIINDILVESNGYIMMGKNDYTISTASGQRYLNSYYDGKKIHIDLHGEINYQSCNYDCWVKYDAWGCPIEFNLERMGDFNSFFGNSRVDERRWNFTSYNSDNAAQPIYMPYCSSFSGTFLGSNVSRIIIDNTNCVSITNLLSDSYNVYDFKVIDSINDKPLSNVVKAGRAFTRCRHGINSVRDKLKKECIDTNQINAKYGDSDPRYYPLWYELVKNADKHMQASTKEGKALVDEFDEKVMPTTTNTFVYNMTNLREANMMFHVWEHWTDDGVWADDEKPKLKITDKYYSYNNGTITLNETRKHDFDKVEITAPNLRSGVGMFYNYPLKVSEARIFAESLPNLNNTIVPRQDITYLSDDGTTKTATFGGSSIIQEFNWFINECKKSNRKSDSTNRIDYLYTEGKDVIETAKDEDAMLGLYYLSKIGDKCGLRDVTNGMVTYCYPSITLFFDLKEENYNVEEAQVIIKIIAEKGWEIATNIPYTYSPIKAMRNRTTLTVDEKTRMGLTASGEQFVIRACEVGGISGQVYLSAHEAKHAQDIRQDYLVEFCKGVSNVITCPDRTAWIRLCQLWRHSLGINTNEPTRNKYGIAQILGKMKNEANYGSSIFFDENGDKYCSQSWITTTCNDFVKRKYNLSNVY